jgi:Uma2 family endonuclease
MQPEAGAVLHRFTVDEYLQMREKGVFIGENPIEMLHGLLVIKAGIIPPYGVPVGIPPAAIWADAGKWGNRPLRRLTTEEYDRLIEADILDPAQRHELLEGWVIDRMTHKPQHDYVLTCLQDALEKFLPKGWCLRVQMGIALDESTPEPDITLVPLPRSNYRTRHPSPHELALLVEVAHATLAYDLGPKRRTYARNGIAHYWVVDVEAQRLNRFADPTGPVDQPDFATHDVLGMNDKVPLIIREEIVGELPVSDFFNY